ncbi:MAG: hypothetical protein WC856_05385 [Methylococcaceae bacterium]
MSEWLNVRQRADVVPPFKAQSAIDKLLAYDHVNAFVPFPFYGIG